MWQKTVGASTNNSVERGNEMGYTMQVSGRWFYAGPKNLHLLERVEDD
jgi:hypothetical protein